MKLQKGSFSKVTIAYRHYTRLQYESDHAKGQLIETCYSKIDPTRSDQNYDLVDGDMLDLFKELKEKAYIRNEQTDVAYYDLCVTYPTDCSVSNEEFFRAVFDIINSNSKMGKCISFSVHKDETRDHAHVIMVPIVECEPFTKSKDVYVFDEKKGREVKRRIKTEYTSKFCAKDICTKEMLKNLHPWMQEQLQQRGIECTIITRERSEFNQWKESMIKETNKKIKQDPEHASDYVHNFWEMYQQMNPKDYKRKGYARPKDNTLNQYLALVEEAKDQDRTELDILRTEIAAKKGELNDIDNSIRKKQSTLADLVNQITNKEYDLSKYLDEFIYERDPDGTLYYSNEFEEVIREEAVSILMDEYGRPTELFDDLYAQHFSQVPSLENRAIKIEQDYSNLLQTMLNKTVKTAVDFIVNSGKPLGEILNAKDEIYKNAGKSSEIMDPSIKHMLIVQDEKDRQAKEDFALGITHEDHGIGRNR